MKRSSIIIIASIIILIIIILSLIRVQKYSLNDITADNWELNLKNKDINTYCIPSDLYLDNIIPDDIKLQWLGDNYEIKRIQQNPTLSISYNKVNDSRRNVTIHSLSSDLYYNVGYEEGHSIDFLNINFINNQYLFEPTITKIILNDGFIRKKTDKKIGFDILIKETNEKFIIVQITLNTLTIWAYKKENTSYLFKLINLK